MNLYHLSWKLYSEPPHSAYGVSSSFKELSAGDEFFLTEEGAKKKFQEIRESVKNLNMTDNFWYIIQEKEINE